MLHNRHRLWVLIWAVLGCLVSPFLAAQFQLFASALNTGHGELFPPFVESGVPTRVQFPVLDNASISNTVFKICTSATCTHQPLEIGEDGKSFLSTFTYCAARSSACSGQFLSLVFSSGAHQVSGTAISIGKDIVVVPECLHTGKLLHATFLPSQGTQYWLPQFAEQTALITCGQAAFDVICPWSCGPQQERACGYHCVTSVERCAGVSNLDIQMPLSRHRSVTRKVRLVSDVRLSIEPQAVPFNYSGIIRLLAPRMASSLDPPTANVSFSVLDGISDNDMSSQFPALQLTLEPLGVYLVGEVTIGDKVKCNSPTLAHLPILIGSSENGFRGQLVATANFGDGHTATSYLGTASNATMQLSGKAVSSSSSVAVTIQDEDCKFGLHLNASLCLRIQPSTCATLPLVNAGEHLVANIDLVSVSHILSMSNFSAHELVTVDVIYLDVGMSTDGLSTISRRLNSSITILRQPLSLEVLALNASSFPSVACGPSTQQSLCADNNSTVTVKISGAVPGSACSVDWIDDSSPTILTLSGQMNADSSGKCDFPLQLGQSTPALRTRIVQLRVCRDGMLCSSFFIRPAVLASVSAVPSKVVLGQRFELVVIAPGWTMNSISLALGPAAAQVALSESETKPGMFSAPLVLCSNSPSYAVAASCVPFNQSASFSLSIFSVAEQRIEILSTSLDTVATVIPVPRVSATVMTKPRFQNSSSEYQEVLEIQLQGPIFDQEHFHFPVCLSRLQLQSDLSNCLNSSLFEVRNNSFAAVNVSSIEGYSVDQLTKSCSVGIWVHLFEGNSVHTVVSTAGRVLLTPIKVRQESNNVAHVAVRSGQPFTVLVNGCASDSMLLLIDGIAKSLKPASSTSLSASLLSVLEHGRTSSHVNITLLSQSQTVVNHTIVTVCGSLSMDVDFDSKLSKLKVDLFDPWRNHSSNSISIKTTVSNETLRVLLDESDPIIPGKFSGAVVLEKDFLSKAKFGIVHISYASNSSTIPVACSRLAVIQKEIRLTKQATIPFPRTVTAGNPIHFSVFNGATTRPFVEVSVCVLEHECKQVRCVRKSTIGEFSCSAIVLTSSQKNPANASSAVLRLGNHVFKPSSPSLRVYYQNQGQDVLAEATILERGDESLCANFMTSAYVGDVVDLSSCGPFNTITRIPVGSSTPLSSRKFTVCEIGNEDPSGGFPCVYAVPGEVLIATGTHCVCSVHVERKAVPVSLVAKPAFACPVCDVKVEVFMSAPATNNNSVVVIASVNGLIKEEAVAGKCGIRSFCTTFSMAKYSSGSSVFISLQGENHLSSKVIIVKRHLSVVNAFIGAFAKIQLLDASTPLQNIRALVQIQGEPDQEVGLVSSSEQSGFYTAKFHISESVLAGTLLSVKAAIYPVELYQDYSHGSVEIVNASVQLMHPVRHIVLSAPSSASVGSVISVSYTDCSEQGTPSFFLSHTSGSYLRPRPTSTGNCQWNISVALCPSKCQHGLSVSEYGLIRVEVDSLRGILRKFIQMTGSMTPNIKIFASLKSSDMLSVNVEGSLDERTAYLSLPRCKSGESVVNIYLLQMNRTTVAADVFRWNVELPAGEEENGNSVCPGEVRLMSSFGYLLASSVIHPIPMQADTAGCVASLVFRANSSSISAAFGVITAELSCPMEFSSSFLTIFDENDRAVVSSQVISKQPDLSKSTFSKHVCFGQENGSVPRNCLQVRQGQQLRCSFGFGRTFPVISPPLTVARPPRLLLPEKAFVESEYYFGVQSFGLDALSVKISSSVTHSHLLHCKPVSAKESESLFLWRLVLSSTFASGQYDPCRLVVSDGDKVCVNVIFNGPGHDHPALHQCAIVNRLPHLHKHGVLISSKAVVDIRFDMAAMFELNFPLTPHQTLRFQWEDRVMELNAASSLVESQGVEQYRIRIPLLSRFGGINPCGHAALSIIEGASVQSHQANVEIVGCSRLWIHGALSGSSVLSAKLVDEGKPPGSTAAVAILHDSLGAVHSAVMSSRNLHALFVSSPIYSSCANFSLYKSNFCLKAGSAVSARHGKLHDVVRAASLATVAATIGSDSLTITVKDADRDTSEAIDSIPILLKLNNGTVSRSVALSETSFRTGTFEVTLNFKHLCLGMTMDDCAKVSSGNLAVIYHDLFPSDRMISVQNPAPSLQQMPGSGLLFASPSQCHLSCNITLFLSGFPASLPDSSMLEIQTKIDDKAIDSRSVSLKSFPVSWVIDNANKSDSRLIFAAAIPSTPPRTSISTLISNPISFIENSQAGSLAPYPRLNLQVCAEKGLHCRQSNSTDDVMVGDTLHATLCFDTQREASISTIMCNLQTVQSSLLSDSKCRSADFQLAFESALLSNSTSLQTCFLSIGNNHAPDNLQIAAKVGMHSFVVANSSVLPSPILRVAPAYASLRDAVVIELVWPSRDLFSTSPIVNLSSKLSNHSTVSFSTQLHSVVERPSFYTTNITISDFADRLGFQAQIGDQFVVRFQEMSSIIFLAKTAVIIAPSVTSPQSVIPLCVQNIGGSHMKITAVNSVTGASIIVPLTVQRAEDSFPGEQECTFSGSLFVSESSNQGSLALAASPGHTIHLLYKDSEPFRSVQSSVQIEASNIASIAVPPLVKIGQKFSIFITDGDIATKDIKTVEILVKSSYAETKFLLPVSTNQVTSKFEFTTNSENYTSPTRGIFSIPASAGSDLTFSLRDMHPSGWRNATVRVEKSSNATLAIGPEPALLDGKLFIRLDDADLAGLRTVAVSVSVGIKFLDVTLSPVSEGSSVFTGHVDILSKSPNSTNLSYFVTTAGESIAVSYREEHPARLLQVLSTVNSATIGKLSMDALPHQCNWAECPLSVSIDDADIKDSYVSISLEILNDGIVWNSLSAQVPRAHDSTVFRAGVNVSIVPQDTIVKTSIFPRINAPAGAVIRLFYLDAHPSSSITSSLQLPFLPALYLPESIKIGQRILIAAHGPSGIGPPCNIFCNDGSGAQANVSLAEVSYGRFEGYLWISPAQQVNVPASEVQVACPVGHSINFKSVISSVSFDLQRQIDSSNLAVLSVSRSVINIGDQLTISAVDSDANSNQYDVEHISLSVNSTCGASGKVLLTETGFDTSIFSAVITISNSQLFTKMSKYGGIRVESGCFLTFTLVDTAPQVVLTQTVAVANRATVSVSRPILLTNPLQIFVRDADASADLSDSIDRSENAVSVQVSCGSSPAVTISISESLDAGGVFSNRTDISGVSSPVPGCVEGARLRIIYTDEMPADTIVYDDFVAGIASIQFTNTVISPSLHFTVMVTDWDANLDPDLREQVNISLTSSCASQNSSFTVELREQFDNSGTFTASSHADGNNAFFGPGCNITATYIDKLPSLNAISASAMMEFPSTIQVAQSINPSGVLSISVTDIDQNQDANSAESIFVNVQVKDVTSSLSMTLQETGLSTGVFSGELQTSTELNSNNLILDQASAGSSIVVSYSEQHPQRAIQAESIVSTVATVSVVGGWILPDMGTSVTVTDSDSAANLSAINSLVVVASQVTSGSHSLPITLTAPIGSEVFSGTLNACTTLPCGQGQLFAPAGSTVSVSFDDPKPLPGSVRSVSALVASSAVVNLPSSILPGSTISVTIFDSDRNSNAATLQTITARFGVYGRLQVEEVTLSETNANSGEFSGSLVTSDSQSEFSSGSGSLAISAGDAVIFEYQEAIPARTLRRRIQVGQVAVIHLPSSVVVGKDFRVDVEDADSSSVSITVTSNSPTNSLSADLFPSSTHHMMFANVATCHSSVAIPGCLAVAPGASIEIRYNEGLPAATSAISVSIPSISLKFASVLVAPENRDKIPSSGTLRVFLFHVTNIEGDIPGSIVCSSESLPETLSGRKSISRWKTISFNRFNSTHFVSYISPSRELFDTSASLNVSVPSASGCPVGAQLLVSVGLPNVTMLALEVVPPPTISFVSSPTTNTKLDLVVVDSILSSSSPGAMSEIQAHCTCASDHEIVALKPNGEGYHGSIMLSSRLSASNDSVLFCPINAKLQCETRTPAGFAKMSSQVEDCTPIFDIHFLRQMDSLAIWNVSFNVENCLSNPNMQYPSAALLRVGCATKSSQMVTVILVKKFGMTAFFGELQLVLNSNSSTSTAVSPSAAGRPELSCLTDELGLNYIFSTPETNRLAHGSILLPVAPKWQVQESWLPDSTISLTVVSAQDNLDSFTIDQISATAANENSQTVIVNLTETSPNSGVFQGKLFTSVNAVNYASRSALGTVLVGTRISLTYMNSAGNASASILIGAPGSFVGSSSSMVAGGKATILLTDSDRDLDSSSLDTVAVSVIRSDGKASQQILMETAVNSGVFQGTIFAAAASSDLRITARNIDLSVVPGASLTVLYKDIAPEVDVKHTIFIRQQAKIMVSPSTVFAGQVLQVTVLDADAAVDQISGTAMMYPQQQSFPLIFNYSSVSSFRNGTRSFLGKISIPNSVECGSYLSINVKDHPTSPDVISPAILIRSNISFTANVNSLVEREVVQVCVKSCGAVNLEHVQVTVASQSVSPRIHYFVAKHSDPATFCRTYLVAEKGAFEHSDSVPWQYLLHSATSFCLDGFPDDCFSLKPAVNPTLVVPGSLRAGGILFVQVAEATANKRKNVKESLQVSIRSSRSPQTAFTFSLVESSEDSGLFQGFIPTIESSMSDDSVRNSVSCLRGDTLTVSRTLSGQPSQSSVVAVKSKVELRFVPSAITAVKPGDTLSVQLLDSELNKQALSDELLVGVVKLIDSADDSIVSVTLAETGPNTGLFTGQVAVSQKAFSNIFDRTLTLLYSDQFGINHTSTIQVEQTVSVRASLGAFGSWMSIEINDNTAAIAETVVVSTRIGDDHEDLSCAKDSSNIGRFQCSIPIVHSSAFTDGKINIDSSAIQLSSPVNITYTSACGTSVSHFVAVNSISILALSVNCSSVRANLTSWIQSSLDGELGFVTGFSNLNSTRSISVPPGNSVWNLPMSCQSGSQFPWGSPIQIVFKPSNVSLPQVVASASTPSITPKLSVSRLNVSCWKVDYVNTLLAYDFSASAAVSVTPEGQTQSNLFSIHLDSAVPFIGHFSSPLCTQHGIPGNADISVSVYDPFLGKLENKFSHACRASVSSPVFGLFARTDSLMIDVEIVDCFSRWNNTFNSTVTFSQIYSPINVTFSLTSSTDGLDTFGARIDLQNSDWLHLASPLRLSIPVPDNAVHADDELNQTDTRILQLVASSEPEMRISTSNTASHTSIVDLGPSIAGLESSLDIRVTSINFAVSGAVPNLTVFSQCKSDSALVLQLSQSQERPSAVFSSSLFVSEFPSANGNMPVPAGIFECPVGSNIVLSLQYETGTINHTLSLFRGLRAGSIVDLSHDTLFVIAHSKNSSLLDAFVASSTAVQAQHSPSSVALSLVPLQSEDSIGLWASTSLGFIGGNDTQTSFVTFSLQLPNVLNVSWFVPVPPRINVTSSPKSSTVKLEVHGTYLHTDSIASPRVAIQLLDCVSLVPIGTVDVDWPNSACPDSRPCTASLAVNISHTCKLLVEIVSPAGSSEVDVPLIPAELQATPSVIRSSTTSITVSGRSWRDASFIAHGCGQEQPFSPSHSGELDLSSVLSWVQHCPTFEIIGKIEGDPVIRIPNALNASMIAVDSIFTHSDDLYEVSWILQDFDTERSLGNSRSSQRVVSIASTSYASVPIYCNPISEETLSNSFLCMASFSRVSSFSISGNTLWSPDSKVNVSFLDDHFDSEEAFLNSVSTRLPDAGSSAGSAGYLLVSPNSLNEAGANINVTWVDFVQSGPVTGRYLNASCGQSSFIKSIASRGSIITNSIFSTTLSLDRMFLIRCPKPEVTLSVASEIAVLKQITIPISARKVAFFASSNITLPGMSIDIFIRDQFNSFDKKHLDSLSISIKNTMSGDVEKVFLIESDIDSNFFHGVVKLVDSGQASLSFDAHIAVQPGNVLELLYKFDNSVPPAILTLVVASPVILELSNLIPANSVVSGKIDQILTSEEIEIVAKNVRTSQAVPLLPNRTDGAFSVQLVDTCSREHGCAEHQLFAQAGDRIRFSVFESLPHRVVLQESIVHMQGQLELFRRSSSLSVYLDDCDLAIRQSSISVTVVAEGPHPCMSTCVLEQQDHTSCTFSSIACGTNSPCQHVNPSTAVFIVTYEDQNPLASVSKRLDITQQTISAPLAISSSQYPIQWQVNGVCDSCFLHVTASLQKSSCVPVVQTVNPGGWSAFISVTNGSELVPLGCQFVVDPSDSAADLVITTEAEHSGDTSIWHILVIDNLSVSAGWATRSPSVPGVHLEVLVNNDFKTNSHAHIHCQATSVSALGDVHDHEQKSALFSSGKVLIESYISGAVGLQGDSILHVCESCRVDVHCSIANARAMVSILPDSVPLHVSSIDTMPNFKVFTVFSGKLQPLPGPSYVQSCSGNGSVALKLDPVNTGKMNGREWIVNVPTSAISAMGNNCLFMSAHSGFNLSVPLTLTRGGSLSISAATWNQVNVCYIACAGMPAASSVLLMASNQQTYELTDSLTVPGSVCGVVPQIPGSCMSYSVSDSCALTSSNFCIPSIAVKTPANETLVESGVGCSVDSTLEYSGILPSDALSWWFVVTSTEQRAITTADMTIVRQSDTQLLLSWTPSRLSADATFVCTQPPGAQHPWCIRTKVTRCIACVSSSGSLQDVGDLLSVDLLSLWSLNPEASMESNRPGLRVRLGVDFVVSKNQTALEVVQSVQYVNIGAFFATNGNLIPDQMLLSGEVLCLPIS